MEIIARTINFFLGFLGVILILNAAINKQIEFLLCGTALFVFAFVGHVILKFYYTEPYFNHDSIYQIKMRNNLRVKNKKIY
ncbi:MAG: hypothetical protein GY861_07045 [bacterium]|nr:hypothetical protein [bacterium]